MSRHELVIEGARQNNLRNISLRLPHNSLIAITGVSGSGKSSLAFDTIFAEGQWRFIESLSSYARLFLEKLDRPDVDAILNIRPAIALEQKNPIRTSRSTVGTLTELYDLFRLLFAKAADPYCPQCGEEIRRWDPAQIVAELVEKHRGERAMILFPADQAMDDLKKRGFHRFRIDGEVIDAESGDAGEGRSIEVVLDRLVIKKDSRLADSVELAWKEGRENIVVVFVGPEGTQKSRTFSALHGCERCRIVLPEPTAMLFSFNHPVGACPECKGFGDMLRYAEDLIVPDKSRSLEQGAVDPWNKPAYRWWRRQLLSKGRKAGLDTAKPFIDFDAHDRELLFNGGEGFHGIDDFFEYLEGKRYKLHVRVFLSRYRRPVRCPVCSGKRLRKEALAYRIGGVDIAELCGMPISETTGFFRHLDLSPMKRDLSQELIRQISMKLDFLHTVGLDYLTLDRYGKTLSGGEYQRVNLSNQLASQLTGTLYVLDEPTVGLHPRDTERITKIMRRLAELGNTVIVVEHDRSVIGQADWIVELGPGGGHRGGRVVFSGTKTEFLKQDTLTARYLRGDDAVLLPARRQRPHARRLSLFGACGHNLRNVDLHVPLGTLTVVSGVSGSGKSTLVVETLFRALTERFSPAEQEAPLAFAEIRGVEHLKGVKLIDQSPIGRTPRSNPVTYLKIFDHIRKVFASQRDAKAFGYGPGFFSFNMPGGRCETCKGEGYELMEMFFFEDLFVTCEKCNGKRYRPEALRIEYLGKNIYETLQLTVEEARTHFSAFPAISQKLDLLIETGLGYLRLGQSATTLSGGEAQRLKICAEMGSTSRNDFLYLLDEPTVGLHYADIQALLNILRRLVDAGNTVVVIEHNLDVIRAADRVIDLGPEGGAEGGRIICEGTPEEIIKCPESHTGAYLRQNQESTD